MVTERPSYAERIVQDLKIMVGKPVIRGTRIPVERVLAHLAHNPDLDDLFAAYPRLSIGDVQAVLTYAHAAVERKGRRVRHRAALDQYPMFGCPFDRQAPAGDLSARSPRASKMLPSGRHP